jgi:hypothetical protein
MSGNLGISGVGCSFPDFDKILDFTSAGSESSTSVSVNGDTDLEYKVQIRNTHSSVLIFCRLNNDSGTNYGYQNVNNYLGSVSAARYTNLTRIVASSYLGETVSTILTPAGFIKTAFTEDQSWQSGTTILAYGVAGTSWNSTANVTTLNFLPTTGNFTAGTRIIVYRRRQN